MNKSLSKKLETGFKIAGLENVRVIVKQTSSAFFSAKEYIGGNGYLLFMSPAVHGRKYGTHFAILSDIVSSEKEANKLLKTVIEDCLNEFGKKEEANVKIDYDVVSDKQVVGVSVEVFVKRENKLNFMMHAAVEYIKRLEEIRKEGA